MESLERPKGRVCEQAGDEAEKGNLGNFLKVHCMFGLRSWTEGLIRVMMWRMEWRADKLKT